MNNAESNIKTAILDTGVRLSAKIGFRNVTRQAIASELDIAAGGITYHFKEMRKLQTAMLRHAIAKENLPVIAQAMMEKHPLVKELPQELRARAARSLL